MIEKRTVLLAVRTPEGKWSDAVKLARDDEDIQDLTTAPCASGNVLVVARAGQSQKWVKVLPVKLNKISRGKPILGE